VSGSRKRAGNARADCGGARNHEHGPVSAEATFGNGYTLRGELPSGRGLCSAAVLPWRFRDCAEWDAKYSRPRNVTKPTNRRTARAGISWASLGSIASACFREAGRTMGLLDDRCGVLAAKCAPSQPPPGSALEPFGQSTAVPQVGSAKKNETTASLHIVCPRGTPSPRHRHPRLDRRDVEVRRPAAEGHAGRRRCLFSTMAVSRIGNFCRDITLSRSWVPRSTHRPSDPPAWRSPYALQDGGPSGFELFRR
jgi:hypothetical protein